MCRPSQTHSARRSARLRKGDILTRLDTLPGQVVEGNSTWHRVRGGSLTGDATDIDVSCVP